MLQTISTLTGEPAATTIMRGIVGADGVRRGAMADVDVFAAFNVEVDGNGNDLWEVKEKRHKVVTNTQAAKRAKPSRSIEQLTADYEAAMKLNTEIGLDINEEFSPDADDFISPWDVD